MADDEGPGRPQETWGSDDSEYEEQLKRELEDVLTRIMCHGHKTQVLLTSFVFQARGVAVDHNKHPTSSGSMANQAVVDTLGLIELLRGNAHNNIFGHRSE